MVLTYQILEGGHASFDRLLRVSFRDTSQNGRCMVVLGMSDATFIPPAILMARTDGVARPLRGKKAKPVGTPVFITDAVTPLGGETLLSLLMKRMAADDDQTS